MESCRKRCNGHRLLYALFRQGRRIGILVVMDDLEFAVQPDITGSHLQAKGFFDRIAAGLVYPAQLGEVLADLLAEEDCR